jgi:hypothetical protein
MVSAVLSLLDALEFFFANGMLEFLCVWGGGLRTLLFIKVVKVLNSGMEVCLAPH